MSLRNVITAFVEAFHVGHDAPAVEADTRRGRNAKMDAFLHQVNGSARFDPANLESQTLDARKKQQTVA